VNFFYFTVLVLTLRAWLEIWFQGDLFVVLRAHMESRLSQRSNFLEEALLCPFCHAHHGGVLFAAVMLVVLYADRFLTPWWTPLWLIPQAIAYGWAAGYLAWSLDNVLPEAIRYTRPRDFFPHDGSTDTPA
jgi:hypothetical protein